MQDTHRGGRVLAKTTTVAGIGTGAAMGVLVLTEVGLPIPIPGDLLMLLLGERASAGVLPLGAAIVTAEAITCVGVIALYFAVRGPAAALTAPARRVVPALITGSTIFVQGHVIAGFVLGDAARKAIDRAKGPILAGVVAFALLGLALLLARRGRTGGSQSWTEASCPACLAVALMAPGFLGDFD